MTSNCAGAITENVLVSHASLAHCVDEVVDRYFGIWRRLLVLADAVSRRSVEHPKGSQQLRAWIGSRAYVAHEVGELTDAKPSVWRHDSRSRSHLGIRDFTSHCTHQIFIIHLLKRKHTQ